jgi:hypothetical protein
MTDVSQVEQIKEAVRKKLSEIAAGWESQSKMNISETEYGDGYCSGQSGCAEHLFEEIEQVLGEIDAVVEAGKETE